MVLSSNHYWNQMNQTPGTMGGGGSIYQGGNNITTRGNEIMEAMPSQKRSQNIAQASLKVLRFYRKACRLIPFILRIHALNSKVTNVGAMRNLGDIIRNNAHFRDPHLVDDKVGRGYELLHEAEFHFTQAQFLYQYLCPPWKAMNDRGFSYLEKAKYGDKSKFLTDFYSNPSTY